MECLLATCVKDRPAVTNNLFPVYLQPRSTDLPPLIGPSHATFHALDDQTFSNSAIAPMMTIMARPDGPPVSMFSRKLISPMLR